MQQIQSKPELGPPMPPLSEQELKELALDIDRGMVFGSWVLTPDEIRSSFMPLMFVDPSDIPSNGAYIYEYLSEAGPVSINGRPIFFSMKILPTENVSKLREMLQQLENQRRQFLGEANATD